MEKIIIHGCGGHAKSVANIILNELDFDVVFVDVNARENETIWGCPVLNSVEQVEAWQSLAHHVGVGDLAKRKLIFDEYKQKGCRFPAISSVNAYIASTAVLAEGVFVGYGAYIGPNVNVNINTIINTRAVVEHDTIVGMHSHISINSTLAGYVKVGNQVFAGAGAVIIDKCTVVDNIVIGAGAVVTADLKLRGTYIGIPAKII